MTEKLIQRMEENMNKMKELEFEFLQSLNDSPLKLGERVSKNYKIDKSIKKKGDKMTVVSMRNYLMMGYRPTEMIMAKKRIIHALRKKDEVDSLLMSDSPQEMFLQYPAYKRAKGHVLVGGLGLGMYPTMIAKKKSVKNILIAEIDKEIIDLIQFKHPKAKVIHKDIRDVLMQSKEKYDFIYIDIHYHTGAMGYINTVIPLRKLIEQRFPNTPNYFWGEDEMKTQYIEEKEEGEKE